MITPRIIIIGAGPCGLGAGWRLTELGYKNFLIVERDTHVGGLASSYRDVNGFTWDIGGHVLHSHYDYFDRVFESVMQGKYLTHERESWIWVFNRFVPYPFQNNIHHLPSGILNDVWPDSIGLLETIKDLYVCTVDCRLTAKDNKSIFFCRITEKMGISAGTHEL